jgi:hypothetical protein
MLTVEAAQQKQLVVEQLSNDRASGVIGYRYQSRYGTAGCTIYS